MRFPCSCYSIQRSTQDFHVFCSCGKLTVRHSVSMDSETCLFGVGNESANGVLVLASWLCFHATGNIHAPGLDLLDGAAYIGGGETTCQENLRVPRTKPACEIPVCLFAGSSPRALFIGIYQQLRAFRATQRSELLSPPPKQLLHWQDEWT